MGPSLPDEAARRRAKNATIRRLPFREHSTFDPDCHTQGARFLICRTQKNAGWSFEFQRGFFREGFIDTSTQLHRSRNIARRKPAVEYPRKVPRSLELAWSQPWPPWSCVNTYRLRNTPHHISHTPQQHPSASKIPCPSSPFIQFTYNSQGSVGAQQVSRWGPPHASSALTFQADLRIKHGYLLESATVTRFTRYRRFSSRPCG